MSINKLILINLILLANFTNFINSEILSYIEKNRKISYIISIKFPDKIKKLPTVYGFYKGKKLEFNNGICIFEEDKLANNFFVVITDKVNYNKESLIKDNQSDCKIFYIERKINKKQSESCYKWNITEQDCCNLPKRLPRNSLVILAPASKINLYNNKSIKLEDDSITNNNICYMPEIILNKNLTKSEINNIFDSILLKSIDINNVHEKTKTKVQEHGQCIIAKNN